MAPIPQWASSHLDATGNPEAVQGGANEGKPTFPTTKRSQAGQAQEQEGEREGWHKKYRAGADNKDEDEEERTDATRTRRKEAAPTSWQEDTESGWRWEKTQQSRKETPKLTSNTRSRQDWGQGAKWKTNASWENKHEEPDKHSKWGKRQDEERYTDALKEIRDSLYRLEKEKEEGWQRRR